MGISIFGVVSGVTEAQQNQCLENQNVFISSDPFYDSFAYVPVKTRLSKSVAEAEEQTNRKARSQAL